MGMKGGKYEASKTPEPVQERGNRSEMHLMSRHMCVGMAEVSNWRVEGRRFCDAWKPRSKGKADEEEEKAWEGRLSSIEGQPQVRGGGSR